MNKSRSSKFLIDEELEIMQEVMNIAFGQATADLAELIGIYVILSVPKVNIIEGKDLSGYIENTISDNKRETICNFKSTSIISQDYWGKLKGKALLIFPFGAGRELISMVESESGQSASNDQLNMLENETIVELGNILIGACVGKLTALLECRTTYSQPRLVNYDSSEDNMFEDIIKANHTVITMNTVFSFENREINGHLFLINNSESIKWLKIALNTFMEQYE